MQEPYKKILEKRRSQIVEQVKWTKELASTMEKQGLLTKDDLRSIETEQNSKNRMYAGLTRLMCRGEPGCFEKFRLLLEEIGHRSMAESLDFDRKRIRWDFEKEIHATCLPSYIDVLSDQLLQSSTTEQDEHIRQRLLVEAKRRLEDLRNSVRQQHMDRDNFRAGLWEAIAGTDRPWNSVARKTKTLSELEDLEFEEDAMLLRKTRELLDQLRGRIGDLRSENRLLIETLSNNRIQVQEDSLSVTLNEGDTTFVNIDRCHQSLDDNHNADTFSINDRHFRISKELFKHVLVALKSHKTASSHEQDEIGKLVQTEDKEVRKFVSQLQSLVAELELWKNRAHRLSSDVKSLEEDRELIASALGVQSPYGHRPDTETLLRKAAGITFDLGQKTTPPGDSNSDDKDPPDHDEAVTQQDQLENNTDLAMERVQSWDIGARQANSSKEKTLKTNQNIPPRSSAHGEDTATTTSETITDITTGRTRRSSTPFMPSRRASNTTLPKLTTSQRNPTAPTPRGSYLEICAQGPDTRQRPMQRRLSHAQPMGQLNGRDDEKKRRSSVFVKSPLEPTIWLQQ